ncbi:hypothetical protein [Nostoc sp. 'Peltigera membranacea cyanobiont' 213]|nr:hypothetical protein [Nostoc sp. 'Peltigera membranacea cyanobiont' 213]
MVKCVSVSFDDSHRVSFEDSDRKLLKAQACHSTIALSQLQRNCAL